MCYDKAMTIFNTRPYWLKYETTDLSLIPFWKLYIASLARPHLCDDEEWGDLMYPNERGHMSRISNLGLNFGHQVIVDPARDKPPYYFLEYVSIPVYDENCETPYLGICDSYRLYGIRQRIPVINGPDRYESRIEYARNEIEALSMARESYQKTIRYFIFPMFYDEVISFEYDENKILVEKHLRNK